MSSQDQIDANRINGAKSHGPVTSEGKAIVAKNGIRHGLLAKTVLLNDESRPRFQLLLDTLREEFQPRNEIELGLVDTLAITKWRQMRVWALETSAVNDKITLLAKDSEQSDPTALAATAYRLMSDESNFLQLMARYDTRFDRQYKPNLINKIKGLLKIQV
jgi:hypothetical protein